MKTSVPKQNINQLNNNLLFKIHPNLIMKQLVLLLIVAFYSATISAQTSSVNDPPPVMELKAYLTTLKSSNVNSRSANTGSQNVENLIYKVQPSIYFNSGQVKTYGEKPRSLFTDVRSLNRINNSTLLKNNIEIVTIKINSSNELNSTIDLSVFSSFKNLKYIYIVSNVSTSDKALSKMIVNYNEKYSIFYTIEKGDSNQ